MEFIQGLFSSEPSIGRLNPVGFILMLLGAAVAFFIAPQLEKRSEEMRSKSPIAYGVGLVLACIGAMIAMSR